MTEKLAKERPNAAEGQGCLDLPDNVGLGLVAQAVTECEPARMQDSVANLNTPNNADLF